MERERVSFRTSHTNCKTPLILGAVAPRPSILLNPEFIVFYGGKAYLKMPDGSEQRCNPENGRVRSLTPFDKAENAIRGIFTEATLTELKPYFAEGYSAAKTAQQFLRPGTNRPIRGRSNRKIDEAWAVFYRAERKFWAACPEIFAAG